MSKSKKGAKPEEKDIKINEEEEIIESETVETEEDSEQDEASEEEEPEEEKAKEKKPKAKKPESSDKEFVNLPFIEKCKKDPVIPVSLLLAFVMIIVAVVYFLLPAAKAPTMDMTLEEFENGFNQCDTTMYFFESGFDISINVKHKSEREILGIK